MQESIGKGIEDGRNLCLILECVPVTPLGILSS